MAEDIPINLPYPRKLDINTQEDFSVYTRRIYGLLGMLLRDRIALYAKIKIPPSLRTAILRSAT